MEEEKDIVKKGAEIVSIPNIENVSLNSKLVEEVSGISDYDEKPEVQKFTYLLNL